MVPIAGHQFALNPPSSFGAKVTFITMNRGSVDSGYRQRKLGRAGLPERRGSVLAEPHQIGAHEGGDPLRISGGPISGFGIVIGCGLVTAVDEIPCLGI